MKNPFEPSVDPWDLLVEHNTRIQALEHTVKQLAQLVEQMSQAHLQTVKNNRLNTQAVDNITRSLEYQMTILMDVLSRVNTPQENNNGQT